MKEIYIDQSNLKLGLFALEDTTKAPFGSARIMKNMAITDRNGIGPRLGTELLGTENTNSNASVGLYNFRKSFGQNEILLKAYDDELEVYSKDHSSAGWWKLKDGFTSDKEFGFVTSLVNVDNQDYCVLCNRYEPYQTWTGAITLLNGALIGAETAITVDSVLTDETFDSKTATVSSTTTLEVADTPWAASAYKDFYVYITSGTGDGTISKISANTSNVITFGAITDPGLCTFEIRKLKFPATGTVIYNGTTIAYTGITKATELTVASAHAAPDNTPLTVVPTEYPENPRGNRLTNYLGRILIGNVRSALAYGSGGALQGYSAGGSYFVSSLSDPTDYTFTATRVAGEGDIISTPYGGGEIQDIVHQEDVGYVFKKKYIEAIGYSQDASDLAIREPLKAEFGSSGRVIKGSDDVYFSTLDNKLTSLGRVQSKDFKPQSLNIGHKIKRKLDGYVFGSGRGVEYRDRIYFPCKSSSASTYNDIVIIWSKINDAFEGIWEIGINDLEQFDSNLYYSESSGPNVYKMLTGHSDVIGETRFPISAEYASHYMNLTPSKANLQAMNSLYFEGYIKGDTIITFNVFKDFVDTAFLTFNFAGTEETFLDGGASLDAFLGGKPLAVAPLGSLSEPDEEGRRHFHFRINFPFEYANYFSVGWESQGEDYDYEVVRYGLGLKETISPDTVNIKSL